ncbi:MAG: VWA domain-containing protein [Pseudonocardiaceae bacterium]|nr:VWA domain-containing protein [Pseudonocardiaceae bacterium]
MTRATDESLRAQVRRLAARLLLAPPRPAQDDRSGTGRLATVSEPGLDLDLDATLERFAEHPRLRADDLRWRGWRRPAPAYVLLVDASGSTTGAPLATAVTTAAALAGRLRPGDELGVVAFWSAAAVLRDLRSPAPASTVLDALFDLQGGDTTDLALGLRTALAQAALAATPRREVLVLTDGMANTGTDPLVVAADAARAGCRVHALALSGEPDAVVACDRLAAAGGGRSAPLLRPSQAPGAVAHVLRP